MAILAFAGKLGECVAGVPGGTVVSTSASFKDPTFADNSFYQSTAGLEGVPIPLTVPSSTEIWLSMHVHAPFWQSGGNNQNLIQILDQAGVACVVLTISEDPGTNGSGHWHLGYRSSGVLTYTTAGADVFDDVTYRLDMQINFATGTVRLYADFQLYFEETGLDLTDTGTHTSLDFFRWVGTQHDVYCSNMFIADEDTRGIRMIADSVTQAGDLLQNSIGSFTNLDSPTLNDTDFISGFTAGQQASFGGATVLTGYETWSVIAVGVTARVSGTGSFRPLIRSSAVNGFGTAFSAGDSVGVPTAPTVFATDPNTALPWANAAAEIAQPGVEFV